MSKQKGMGPRSAVAIIAGCDQHAAAARKHLDDFERIGHDGPNGTECDVLIMRFACGLAVQALLIAELENKEP